MEAEIEAAERQQAAADQEALAKARQGTYDERAADKNWKIRADLFDEILQSCSSVSSADDPSLQTYGPLFAKGLGDAQANVQDKALEALVAYLQVANERIADGLAQQCCSVIVNKALKGRASTVKLSSEALMQFVELEQQEAVLAALTAGFAAKVPKVVTAAVEIMLGIVSEFGIHPDLIPPKQICSAIPPLFTHKDSKVRGNIKAIAVEVAKWLGVDASKVLVVDKMPDSMQKEVQKDLEALTPPVAKRFLRKDTERRGATVSGDGGTDKQLAAAVPAVVQEQPQAMDLYDLTDPVDILSALPKSFYKELQAEKWNTRKAALTTLKDLAKSPHLAAGDYGDVMRELRKILSKDSNVVCIAEAINCYAMLAQGLRRDFASQARSACETILDKFKEKNTNVTTACREALTNMHKHCWSLVEVMEDVAVALEHKNPKLRLETLQLLQGMVPRESREAVCKIIPGLGAAVAKAAMEALPEVRDAALQVLANFALKLGGKVDKPLTKFVEKLDEAKQRRLTDLLEQAAQGDGTLPTVPIARISTAGSAGGPPSARGPRPAALSLPTSGAAGRESQASTPGIPRPASGGSKKAVAGCKAKAGTGGSKFVEDEGTLNAGLLSPEEVTEQLTQLLGQDIMQKLSSADWKERKKAMDALTGVLKDEETDTETVVESDKGTLLQSAPLLVQGLATTPGWSEKNFQVMAATFDTFTILAQESYTFGKKEAFLVIANAHERLGDPKLKNPSHGMLTAFAESVGPLFVATHLHTKAAAHKNPKVLAEALLWLSNTINDFGVAALDIKQLVDWAKADLGNSVPAIKNAGIAMVVAMHKQLGPNIIGMLEEHLKPALLASVKVEFDKNPKLQEYAPSRMVRKPSMHNAKAVNINAVAGGILAEEALDEDCRPAAVVVELPRTDISAEIAPLLKPLDDKDTKLRMKAVDELFGVLRSAGNRIEANVGDLIPALKARLSDSNKNLAAKVMTLLGEIAKAMGPPFQQHYRPVITPALLNLYDTKKHVREAVMTMLDGWVTVIPPERLLPYLLDALAAPKCSPEGKKQAIAWMIPQLVESKRLVNPACLDALLRICATTNADKKSDVRSDADALLSAVMEVFQEGQIQDAIAGLESGQRKQAADMVQKLQFAGGVMPSAVLAVTKPSSRPSTAAGPRVEDPPATARPATARGPGPAGPLTARRPMTARNRPSQTSFSSGPPPVLDRGPGLMLVVNDRKDDRTRKLLPRMRGYGGKYEARADDLESLESDMGPYASEVLRPLLFHKDFKKHMEAAHLLTESLTEQPEGALTCMDLLLRWIVLRQTDSNTNTQCLLKLLELCKGLLVLLQQQEMQLTELEALVLVPCLVEKCGHNQDRLRIMYRELIQLCCSVYSLPRVLEMLMLAVQNSKNNRSRVEACEEACHVLESQGLAVCQGLKHKPLPICAQLVSERDKALRQAALNVISTVYLQEGANIWKYLGKVSPQQHSLIEERFRHIDKQHGGPIQAQPRPASSPVGHRKLVSSTAFAREHAESPRHNRADPAHSNGDAVAGPPEGPSGSMAMAGPRHVRAQTSYVSSSPSSSYGHHQMHMHTPDISSHMVSQHSGRSGTVTPADGVMLRRTTSHGTIAANTPLPGQLSGGSVEAAQSEAVEEQWSRGIVLLHSDNPVEYAEGMKVLASVLRQAAEGRVGGRTMVTLAASANELVLEVSRKLDEAFRCAMETHGSEEEQDWVRVARYALNALMVAFPTGQIAKALSLTTLRHNISTVLVLLLDDVKLNDLFQGEAMLKAMNVVMLRVLENADKTLAFMALMQLLRNPPPEAGGKGTEAGARFMDLLVKCMIKLTKTLPSTIDSVDVAQILCGIHEYFTDLGLDEIRRRGNTDDKPLRMMKTLLHELCKVKGFAIHDHLTLVPRDSENEPIIICYITLNLKSLVAAGILSEDPCSASLNPKPLINGDQHSGSPRLPTIVAHASRDFSNSAASSPTVAPPASPSLIFNQRLASIFSRIADPATQEEGLHELYRLKQENPGMNLEQHPSIATKSMTFRTFIHQGLKDIEQGRRPSLNHAENMSGVHNSAAPRVPAADIKLLAAVAGQAGEAHTGEPPAHRRSASSAISLESLQRRMANLRAKDV